MPIYEYQCCECGHKLEAIQRFSDPLLTDCPACGKPRLKKLLSPAGFQLKGTGWYATDFRDSGKNKKHKAKADSGESKSSAEEKPQKKEEKKAATGSDD